MTECPPEFYECLTEEQYDEILDILDENELAMPSSIEALGDGEAAANFVWNVLFLTPAAVSYTHLTLPTKRIV